VTADRYHPSAEARNPGFLEETRGLHRWRLLVIVAVLAAAAALAWAPSRWRLTFVVLAWATPLVIGLDVRWLLLAFPAVAVFVPLQIGTGTDVSLNAAVLGAGALVGLGTVKQLISHDLHLKPSRLNRPLIALSLVTLLSLLSGNLMWGLGVPRPLDLLLVQLGQLAIYYLSFLMFWLTANLFRTQEWLRRLTYAFVGTGALGALSVLFLGFLPFVQRFRSTAMHNMLTIWVVGLGAALAIYDSQLKRSQKSLVTLACIATAAGAVATWLVKGDWVGGWAPTLITLGLVLWFAFPKARWGVVLGLLLIIVAAGPGDLLELIGINFGDKWDISGGSRLTLWRAVTTLALRRPVLGLGIAAYRHYHYIKPLVYQNALWMNPRVSAHNMFVDLFAQTGVAGLMCYLWFMVEAMLIAWRLYRRGSDFTKAYGLAAFCALFAIAAADMLAETSLPYVYNLGFFGFRTSVLSWMMLGGLAALEEATMAAEMAPG